MDAYFLIKPQSEIEGNGCKIQILYVDQLYVVILCIFRAPELITYKGLFQHRPHFLSIRSLSSLGPFSVPADHYSFIAVAPCC